MSSNGGARRDAAVGVAVGRVVDEPAGVADPLLRGRRLAHGPKGTLHAVEIDRPPPGEELNLTARRPSRARRRPSSCCAVAPTRSRSCSSSAPRTRGSWAACGSSPAARSTRPRARATPHTASRRCASSQEEAGDRARRPRRAREVLALDHARRGRGALRHALLPGAAARRPGGDDRRRRDRRRGLVHARRRARRPRARRDRARLPDHQAPRAARRLRQRRRAAATSRAGATSARSQPRVVTEGETARLLLPGEPGYDD